MNNTKWLLLDKDLPDSWLNLALLLKDEYPIPHTKDDEPVDIATFSNIFSEECAKIELLDGKYGKDLHISIPGEILDEYRKYRTTPLFRARGLEKSLGYGGRIFYKREDINPTGSHKPNTAFPQAYYASKQGLKGLITDTGAGQWGAAIALACHRFGLDCTVFMTRDSFTNKPYRRYLMELSGAKVYASPSSITKHGKKLLAMESNHQGSLGIGMGEAMEIVNKNPDMRLALGCMSYYAALHQTVVGQELVKQLELADCKPDILVGCVGGGTNLVGFVSPFLQNRLQGKNAPRMVAAESANVPVLTEGEYRYEFADTFGLTFKILMYTKGKDFPVPKSHSGGLRYHGKSVVLSSMVKKGFVEPAAVSQTEAFAAGRLFFESEGVLPAPESSHAIAVAIREAKQALKESVKKDIVFCLSGTGYLDLLGYAKSFNLAE